MADPSVATAARPRLMFYCQHSVGLGHLVRSLTVAGGLAEVFDVVLLSGGPLPEALAAPPGVELISLPPLGYSSDFGLVSRDPQWSVEQACQLRTWRILDEFRARRPDVLLIELFPFGRRKFGFELLPLLAEAQAAVPRPLVATSLRDILVGRRGGQRDHDQRACDLANRYLDAVLVHSDPAFARLEDSFAPTTPLTVPVCYTGFVRAGERRPQDRPQRPKPRVLVSAGGGMVGEPLFRAAVAAAPALQEHQGLTTSIVAGPFLPEPAWTELQRTARQRPGLEVRRYVPDLAAEMADSAATVSQGGYNTTMDLLASGTPALVVPYADHGEDEQLERGRRLERLGALRVLEAAALDGSTLAAAVSGLLCQRPPVPDLDLDGRAHTVRVVAELAGVRPNWSNGSGGSGKPAHRSAPVSSWLDPLRRALDGQAEGRPARFFFRDDDVGLASDRLWALLDRFDRFGLPVDLAVIPAALTPPLTGLLGQRLSASPGRLAVHQHGYAHDNHEPAGRKYEFGPSRTPQQQHGDIRRGRDLLAAALGPDVAPIFTPPWNRCTPSTGRSLLHLGVRVLSRDETAAPLDLPGLVELPVRVDWFAHRKGVRHSRPVLGTLLAETVAAWHPVGVMLHHELMGDEELADLSQLLRLVAGHQAAVGSPMLELAGVPAATAE